MPFPRRLLNDNEEIVLDLHPHWWFFAPLLALLGAIAPGCGCSAAPTSTPRPAGIVILVALVWFGWRYLRWVTTNFVVTTDRLIYRHGVLSKHGIEIPLDRVNTVFFSQSVFERVVARVTWSSSPPARRAASASPTWHPSAVQNEIYRQMEANENRKFDRVRPVGAERAGGGPRARRLLHPVPDPRAGRAAQAGRAQRSEFAQKKQQLLDRMWALPGSGQPGPFGHRDAAGLGVIPVACTRFCEQPDLPHVGGTKDPDVAPSSPWRPTSW